ncbi:hypothetical protein BLOT_013205 [Blomia tropicalis]|nr:hypothetical protein BLOT_013205 [Blomia tropicalis]
MPFDKWMNMSKPIVLNKNYIQSPTGIIKCTQCFIGFGSVLAIGLACRSNYDPYYGTNSGFVGGNIETLFLLIHFTFFFLTVLIISTYYFSIIASTIIPKTVFEFVYDILACALLFITSLILLITACNRNQNLGGFPPEPGFGGKITASIFGLLNSFLYGADTYFSYRSYIQS